MSIQKDYKSEFDIALISYVDSYRKFLHSLNLNGNLEYLLIDLYKNKYPSIEIEPGFLNHQKYSTNLILKYNHSAIGLDFSTKIFLIAIGDKDQNYMKLIDAIATGTWAYNSEKGIVLITGEDNKKQLKIKKDILKRLSNLQIDHRIVIFCYNEVVQYIFDIGGAILKNIHQSRV